MLEPHLGGLTHGQRPGEGGRNGAAFERGVGLAALARAKSKHEQPETR
ncbi:hypothetical protein G6O69_23105 [Pseudenhygromyxa sp. WMMC2535]|nr:hypothetical protein [Pseudenhygromyxa sp. WMMC2535]NVB40747.1 hypothetical protein [Pseudenhygromyxa sp. WMMC2535]